MESLSQRIQQSLKKEGASLVGFADLNGLSSNMTNHLPYAVSIALALNPLIIAQIQEGPTPAYYEEYQRANLFLSHLGKFTADLLREHGYRAQDLEPTTENFDQKTLSTTLPHKTVATRAGLGWIGKSALLITNQYGSAIRLTSVLTDYPLPTAEPIHQSLCGDCKLCVERCPSHAPLGNNWDIHYPRENFFNAFSCHQTALNLSQSAGIDSTICGICIVSCPWTQQYLMRSKHKSC